MRSPTRSTDGGALGQAEHRASSNGSAGLTPRSPGRDLLRARSAARYGRDAAAAEAERAGLLEGIDHFQAQGQPNDGRGRPAADPGARALPRISTTRLDQAPAQR